MVTHPVYSPRKRDVIASEPLQSRRCTRRVASSRNAKQAMCAPLTFNDSSLSENSRGET